MSKLTTKLQMPSIKPVFIRFLEGSEPEKSVKKLSKNFLSVKEVQIFLKYHFSWCTLKITWFWLHCRSCIKYLLSWCEDSSLTITWFWLHCKSCICVLSLVEKTISKIIVHSFTANTYENKSNLNRACDSYSKVGYRPLDTMLFLSRIKACYYKPQNQVQLICGGARNKTPNNVLKNLL